MYKFSTRSFSSGVERQSCKLKAVSSILTGSLIVLNVILLYLKFVIIVIFKRKNNIMEKDNKNSNYLLPQNFNWKIVKEIVQYKNIKNELEAKNYFRKNVKSDEEFRKNYFKTAKKIPSFFDDDKYIEYLTQEHNLKFVQGDINFEKLYDFYNKIGKKKYPLDKKYFAFIKMIEEDFDEDLYKTIYSYKNTNFVEDLNKFENIFLFYNEIGKYKYPLDDAYYKIYYNIPEYFDMNIYKDIYKNKVSFDKHKNIYKFYFENNNKYFLNEKYFQKYYNIFDLYDENSYLKFNPNSSILKNKHDMNIYFKYLQQELASIPLTDELLYFVL